MTWKEQFNTLARYNAWMNEKLYVVASQLSPEECKRDLGAFFGSIHATLNHLLLTDCAWLARFTRDASFLPRASDGSPILIQGLDQELYEHFVELRAQRQQLDARICEWVGSLTEPTLLKEMRYKTTSGEPRHHPLWLGLSHFFNHQTHHRGQITTMIVQLCRDPGVTDLVDMYCEESARAC